MTRERRRVLHPAQKGILNVMSSLKEGTYYSRYRAAATRFEIIGCILLLIAVLLHVVLGNSILTVSLLLAAVGAFLLIIGGSSLRPHNMVKAFAQQCTQEPCREAAEGLLTAIQASPKIRLVQKSIDSVSFAIELYECLDDADAELVQQLRDAVEAHIAKKPFSPSCRIQDRPSRHRP